MSRGRGGHLFLSLRAAIYFYQRFPWDVNSHLPSTSRIFLFHTLSLLCFASSYIYYLKDTMRLTPVLGGVTPEYRETRPESLFPSRWMLVRQRWDARDGTRVIRCAYYDYIIFPQFSFFFSLRNSHLLFIYLLHLQSSYVLLGCILCGVGVSLYKIFF